MPFAVLGGLVLWSIWFQWHGHPLSWKCCIWSHQQRALTQDGLIVFPLSIQIGLILQILFILIHEYRYLHHVGYLGIHHVVIDYVINLWEFVQCCLIGLTNSKLLSLLGNKFGSPLLQKYLPSIPNAKHDSLPIMIIRYGVVVTSLDISSSHCMYIR